MMLAPVQLLHAWFMRLSLQGKLTVGLVSAALAMGVVVTLTVFHVLPLFLPAAPATTHMLDIIFVVFLVIGAAIVIVMMLFAEFWARLFEVPLAEVAHAAERISRSGRPEGYLPVRGNDEFARLTMAFNTMIERLATSYADLEQRVAERTREYEESQHEAQRAINLLREAVDNVAVGFTIYDEYDRLVMCNEAYLRIYEESRDLIVPGASFEEIIRKGAERGQYRAAIGRIDEWVRERLAIHQSARGEVLEQDLGDGRWLMIIEYRTPSGYIVGNRIDISNLKRTEAALRQRELYLRATLDNLPFFFWLKDAESRFLTVNKVFSDACGRAAPDEVVGLTDDDVWPADLAERYRADDLEVMASRKEKAVEEPVAGGTAAGWIETYKKPVIADDGTVLGTVGFARDISDRRFAELALRDRNEQLNAIFELSPDGFVSFDRERRVKYASPAFLRMTRLAEQDVVGLGERAFSSLLAGMSLVSAPFPGMRALHDGMPDTAKVGAGGTAAPAGPADNMGTAAPAEAPRILFELAGPPHRVIEVGLRLSQADTVSQILYFRDITHETEVDQMKSEFLSHAAHELRTPMASIYGFTELLMAQEFSAEEQQELLGTIYRQSELMIKIINELLDLARIEARRGQDFEFKQLDLCRLIEQVIAGFKPPGDRAPPLHPCQSLSCQVRADANKLTQAIQNVLSNAYKYSPDGGAVVIDLVQRQRGEGGNHPAQTGIRISDHGIGMTPEQLSRLFERFYRADTSGKIPGTGLGMSIVKEIIEFHHGQVEVTSQAGAGSQVTLWLPAERTPIQPGEAT